MHCHECGREYKEGGYCIKTATDCIYLCGERCYYDWYDRNPERAKKILKNFTLYHSVTQPRVIM